METAIKVREILVEHLGLDMETVRPEANLSNDLGADSLDRLELTMALEDEFNILIEDAEADKINTVQECIDFIEKKTNAQGVKRVQ